MNHPPELGKLFEELAALLHFSPEEEKRLSKPVQGAIVLNVMMRLFEALPEDKKKYFTQQSFKDSTAIIDFFKSAFSEEEMKGAMEKSTQKVLAEFEKGK